MKFARIGRMRIPAGQDRASTGAARGTGQVRTVKSHPLGGDLIDVRRANNWIAIRSGIVPGHVIRNKDDEVRAFIGLDACNGSEQEKKEKGAMHWMFLYKEAEV